MALFPHGFFPRSAMDMDKWFSGPIFGGAYPFGSTYGSPSAYYGGSPSAYYYGGSPTTAYGGGQTTTTTPQQQLQPFGGTYFPFGGPTTMDMYDAFDDLDAMLGRNYQWINKPDFLPEMPLQPRVPQKYRITVDVTGFTPDKIKTEINGLKLKVWAKEETRHEGEDFFTKEFKKTYTLPANAITDKMVSFVTAHGHLVIEVPLKETDKHKNVDMFPKIIDTKDGKQVTMKFGVPENIDPSKVTVSIKDRDVIVKAEDKIEKPDGISKFYFYKRTTLPENTMFGLLKCTYDNHMLSITAPLDLDYKTHKQLPFDYYFKKFPITQTPHF